MRREVDRLQRPKLKRGERKERNKKRGNITGERFQSLEVTRKNGKYRRKGEKKRTG